MRGAGATECPELEGFDVELGNAICKAAALKCTWVETSFDALIPGH